MLRLLFVIVECVIARFLCAMRVFEVRAHLRGSRRRTCGDSSRVFHRTRAPLEYSALRAYLHTQTGYTDRCPFKQQARLNPSTPAVPDCCCSKGPAPYWSNLSFLIFDIRALWRSGLSARAPECQKIKILG